MQLEPPDLPEYNALREDAASLEVVEQGKFSTVPQPPEKRSLFDLKRNKRAIITALIILGLLCLSVAGFIFMRNLPSSQSPTTNVVINTQSLDNGTLNELTSDTGGDKKQQLTISPNTLFKNDVLMQGSAQVLKDLNVGGNATIQSAANIRDSLTVGRSLTVGTNLSVNGIITAASLNVGTINISSINISGNLVFGGHIIPGGAAPAARASNAAGGGSVTINGNDTSGTISIRTGGGPISGELAVITFRSAFNTVPKVQLTPIGEAGTNLRYFATRSSNFFSVNTGTTPAANTTYVFDYLVTQ